MNYELRSIVTEFIAVLMIKFNLLPLKIRCSL
jgi:hypothetical protein